MRGVVGAILLVVCLVSAAQSAKVKQYFDEIKACSGRAEITSMSEPKVQRVCAVDDAWCRNFELFQYSVQCNDGRIYDAPAVFLKNERKTRQFRLEGNKLSVFAGIRIHERPNPDRECLYAVFDDTCPNDPNCRRTLGCIGPAKLKTKTEVWEDFPAGYAPKPSGASMMKIVEKPKPPPPKKTVQSPVAPTENKWPAASGEPRNTTPKPTSSSQPRASSARLSAPKNSNGNFLFFIIGTVLLVGTLAVTLLAQTGTIAQDDQRSDSPENLRPIVAAGGASIAVIAFAWMNVPGFALLSLFAALGCMVWLLATHGRHIVRGYYFSGAVSHIMENEVVATATTTTAKTRRAQTDLNIATTDTIKAQGDLIRTAISHETNANEDAVAKERKVADFERRQNLAGRRADARRTRADKDKAAAEAERDRRSVVDLGKYQKRIQEEQYKGDLAKAEATRYDNETDAETSKGAWDKTVEEAAERQVSAEQELMDRMEEAIGDGDFEKADRIAALLKRLRNRKPSD